MLSVIVWPDPIASTSSVPAGNEQASVESFHRTLWKECLGWSKYKRCEMEELQKEIQEYLEYYHYERPHLGLDMGTPLPPICRI
jgi:transposase InsO family protein